MTARDATYRFRLPAAMAATYCHHDDRCLPSTTVIAQLAHTTVTPLPTATATTGTAVSEADATLQITATGRRHW